MSSWDPRQQQVIGLPSGRSLRGRGRRQAIPVGLEPEFGLYLQATPPAGTAWPSRWVRWRDWWLPADPDDAYQAFAEAWQRASAHRVDVVCGGGRGRTGTALACIAILDGVPSTDAVSYVRRHYHRQAIETPWQRRFVTRFGDLAPAYRPTGPDPR